MRWKNRSIVIILKKYKKSVYLKTKKRIWEFLLVNLFCFLWKDIAYSMDDKQDKKCRWEH